MEALRNIARGYILFVCWAGYIFGQLFFGEFSFDAMVIGVAGTASAILWTKYSKESLGKQKFTSLAALITLAACGYETYFYYTYLNSPGNDFAWFMRGPLYLLLLLVLINSSSNLTRRGSRDGLQPPLH